MNTTSDKLPRYARALAACLLVSICSLPLAALAAGAWVDGQAADVVLGQFSFSTSSGIPSATRFTQSVTGVAVDPTTGKVFVSNGNRILRFSSAAAAVSSSAAEAWFGQASATANSPNAGGAPSAKTLSLPEQMHVDSAGRLWVADLLNNRILRFDNASSKASNSDADGVLGQATFLTVLANRGASVGANTMNRPIGVWNDGNALWVADSGNNRVLGFTNAASKPNGAVADVVLGQPDFLQSGVGPTKAQMNLPAGIVVSSNGSMFVADQQNARVLRFDNVGPIAKGASADSTLGYGNSPPGAGSMAAARGLALDADGRLYVSDFAWNRVLIFNDAAHRPSGVDADNLLGQSSYTDIGTNTRGLSGSSLSGATGLAFDTATNSLWVSDYSNGRVLRFSPAVGLLDIDASGNPSKFDALSDGLLVLRYLFGLTGAPLTNGALGGTATRIDPTLVKSYLDSIRPSLDVDRDGNADALTDGLLILRYLFGLRGASLISNAVAPNALRNSPLTIETYIQSLMQ